MRTPGAGFNKKVMLGFYTLDICAKMHKKPSKKYFMRLITISVLLYSSCVGISKYRKKMFYFCLAFHLFYLFGITPWKSTRFIFRGFSWMYFSVIWLSEETVIACERYFYKPWLNNKNYFLKSSSFQIMTELSLSHELYKRA